MKLSVSRAIGVAIGATYLLASVGAVAQSLPPRVREALLKHLSVNEEQIKQIENGEVVAYSIETGNPEDIMLVGVGRIKATPSFFVKMYRDITEFEKAPGILASGKFRTPPSASDLNGLAFTKDEVDDMRDCKPGDCAFKVGDSGLARLRQAINWSSGDYVEQANRAVRQLWMENLARYQREGNKALAYYHDTETIFSVEQGLRSLIAKTPVLRESAPGMADYLHDYPKKKPAGTEEFFYWQVGDFGLKPVHRITHVMIGRGSGRNGEAYLIASKMLWASHYFRSALELRYLIPGQDPGAGGVHYLITIQRSYVDGLSGLKGKLIRGTIISRSRKSMESYIASVREKVEAAYRAQAK